MFSVKKAAAVAIAGFALSFLLSIFATGQFGTALLRGVLFAVIFAAGAIAIDFLNTRFLSGEGSDFPSLTPDTPQKKMAAKTTGNVVSIVIDDANLTEEPAAPDFDVSANGSLLRNLDSKEKKTPEKPAETSSTQQSVVPEKTREGESATAKTDSGKPDVKKPVKSESAPHGGGDKTKASKESGKSTASTPQAKKENEEPVHTEETFKPMQLDAIAGEAKKTESAAERKHERLQQIDELPDFAALTSASEAQRDDGLISDSEFAESEPEDEDDGKEENVSSVVHGELPVDYDSETIASAIRTLLKRDE